MSFIFTPDHLKRLLAINDYLRSLENYHLTTKANVAYSIIKNTLLKHCFII